MNVDPAEVRNNLCIRNKMLEEEMFYCSLLLLEKAFSLLLFGVVPDTSFNKMFNVPGLFPLQKNQALSRVGTFQCLRNRTLVSIDLFHFT